MDRDKFTSAPISGDKVLNSQKDFETFLLPKNKFLHVLDILEHKSAKKNLCLSFRSKNSIAAIQRTLLIPDSSYRSGDISDFST